MKDNFCENVFLKNREKYPPEFQCHFSFHIRILPGRFFLQEMNINKSKMQSGWFFVFNLMKNSSYSFD